MGKRSRRIISQAPSLFKKASRGVVDTAMGAVGKKRTPQSQSMQSAMASVQAVSPIMQARPPAQTLAGSSTIMTSALGVVEEARTRRATLGA